MAARIQLLRHWQLPGPKVKLLPHNAKAFQSAVRSNSPQAQAMLAWVQERLTEACSPEKATRRFFPKLPAILSGGRTPRPQGASGEPGSVELCSGTRQ